MLEKRRSSKREAVMIKKRKKKDLEMRKAIMLGCMCKKGRNLARKRSQK